MDSTRDYGMLINSNSGKGAFWYAIPRKNVIVYVPGNRKARRCYESKKFQNRMNNLGAVFDFQSGSLS